MAGRANLQLVERTQQSAGVPESSTLLSMTLTPAADIAFLRSIYETERQADFDCAAYAAFTGAAYIDFSDQDWSTYFKCFSQCSNNATNTYHLWVLSFSFCVSVSVLHMCLLYIFSLLWPHFGFDMLFVLSALLFALREAFKLQPVKGRLISTRSYSSIFHSLFFYHRLLLFRESRQKRFSCSSTLEPRSRPCAVGRLGTIERRRRVTVLVKPWNRYRESFLDPK